MKIKTRLGRAAVRAKHGLALLHTCTDFLNQADLEKLLVLLLLRQKPPHPF